MKLRALAAVMALTIGGLASTAGPASAADREWTNCPELTGSITRLYSAYFLRPPDTSGFDYWADLWSSGDWDLPRISSFFSESPEFISTYGNLGNGDFVDLVYDNVLGRAPDSDGRAYWIGELGSGLQRGHMMLLFSESDEYYQKSGTTPFYGGAFKTLPKGAKFWCGTGAQEITGIEYDWRSDVWATYFAEVLPSDDDRAGGNFIVKVAENDRSLVNLIANDRLYWDEPTLLPRTILSNNVVRYRRFSNQPTVLQIQDSDADEMRWWIVIFPSNVDAEPFPDAQINNG